MQRNGAPERVINSYTEKHLGSVVVEPSNWQAFEVFLATCDSWHISPRGQRLGLIRSDLSSSMQMLQVADTRDCFTRVRHIELGVKKAQRA